MRLHKDAETFRELISIVAADKHLPESAIERDYYIVLLLKNLSESEYADRCVFKGGTSLSKCYPGSIERFSEDIDLTYLGMEESDKVCDRTIKKIEVVMTEDAQMEKIAEERSNRSKSMYVWFDNKDYKVKLEIGSSVRPEPYSKKTIKTYIQEFLEQHDGGDDIAKYGLSEICLNVLSIERTFIDKLMAIKRHAICGTIDRKVRHIYDVERLYNLPEIQAFIRDESRLRQLIRMAKETDSFYLNKRNISKEYDPTGAYDFESWRWRLDAGVRQIYESLHKELLYTDERQNLDDAIAAFEKINSRLAEIGE